MESETKKKILAVCLILGSVQIIGTIVLWENTALPRLVLPLTDVLIDSMEDLQIFCTGTGNGTRENPYRVENIEFKKRINTEKPFQPYFNFTM